MYNLRAASHSSSNEVQGRKSTLRAFIIISDDLSSISSL